MKKLIIALVLLAMGSGYAEEAKTQAQLDRERRMRGKAAYKARREAKTGGRVIKPGTGSGSFIFINAEKYVGADYLQHSIERFRKEYRIDIKTANADGVTAKNVAEVIAKNGANAGLVFVECDECPTTVLLAPEQGWGIVNAKALSKDDCKEGLLQARAMKELVRGFAMVATGAGSQYPQSLLAPMRTLKDLDSARNDMIPPDVDERISNVIGRMGIQPYTEANYIDACQQGWAPAPTNDNQKAIWDKVHEIPTNPIKIKFDPKTGK